MNPLEEAAAFLGRTPDDADGEKAMRTAYSMINIAVGVRDRGGRKGKVEGDGNHPRGHGLW